MNPQDPFVPTTLRSSFPSRLLTACAFSAALALAGAPASDAAIFTVGSTAQGCTSPDLAAALFGAAFSAGDDTIRVVNDQSNVDLDLINWDPDGSGALTIIGGFTSCSDTTSSGRTLITGNSSGPVFSIQATGGTSTNNESMIRLEGLDIRSANGFYGVEVSGSGADLEMVNSSIRFSDGGLKVSGGADADLDVNSAVTQNDVGAGQGGGIHCTGTGSTVKTSGATSFNDAGTGGGIWVTSGCVTTLRDGVVIEDNTATWGGGIAVSGSGSTLITESGLTYGKDIRDNSAVQEGGGLWVVNSAGVVLFDTWIRNNSAGDEGGGIYIDSNAIFAMDRSSTNCFAKRCSRLDGNSLDSEGFGSAVYVGGNADAGIYETYIENHTAQNQRGFVVFAEDAGTTLYLESVQLWNNNTWALFRALGNAVIDASWVSAAANDYLNVLGTILVSSAGATTDTTGIVSIEASILQDHDTFFSAGGGSVTATCSYLATSGGLSGGTTTLQTGTNPGYLDKGRGDLRVYASSPTVDQCNAFAPTQRDIDHKPRGFDEPGGFVGDVHDWGAFEAYGLFFADGFESGSTSRWSSTTP